MNRFFGLRLLAAALLLLGLLGLLAPAATAQTTAGTVDIVEVVGPIDRSVAGFVTGAIAAANERGSEVLVVRLDTPGGVGAPLDELLEAIRTSAVPIAVWVGPPGAQAASAGFWIAQNAHVLALAPATALGVGLPVNLSDRVRATAQPSPEGGDPNGVRATAQPSPEGGDPNGVRATDVPSVRPGRSPEFVAAAAGGKVVIAVPEGETGVPVPADAALPAGADRGAVETLDEAALAERRIADFVAGSLPEVLTRLNGREVQVAGPTGTSVTRTIDVDPQRASVRFVNMGLVARVLHTVANPTLAYLLVIGGMLTLFFEVFQPGFGVAGVSGIAVLGLGAYGLMLLPTSWGGVALVVLGLVLLAADLALARLGLLTLGGTLALLAGSWLAFPGPATLRPSPWLIGAVVAFCVLFFVVIMTVVLRAQGNQALAGAQSVIGCTGVVRSMLNPEGHVFVRGALWRARAPESVGTVRTGTKVHVVGMNDQLTLDVALVEEPETADSEA